MEEKLLNKLKEIVKNGGSEARLRHNKEYQDNPHAEIADLKFVWLDNSIEVDLETLFPDIQFYLCDEYDNKFAHDLAERCLESSFFYRDCKEIWDTL